MMKRIKNYLHEVMDFYGANYLYLAKDLRTAWSFFHAYFYTYFQLIILSLLFSAARPRDCMRCAVPDFLIFFSILF